MDAMATKKLNIIREKEKSTLDFDYSDPISALFNPNRLAFSKNVNWSSQNAAKRDTPESQFNHGEARSLNLELFFDTYDTPSPTKEKVTKYTDKILHLATVEEHGEKHRPPVCLLFWGAFGMFFQGVLENLEQQFTLFLEDGMPVRATLRCTFKEWRTNEDDQRRQNLQSSDIAKMRIVKRGESLSHIAAEEYRDPRQWRAIANENGIDDPRNLAPGTVLLIPTLSERYRT
jgi:nucleoid-associated protein YgaU